MNVILNLAGRLFLWISLFCFMENYLNVNLSILHNPIETIGFIVFISIFCILTGFLDQKAGNL